MRFLKATIRYDRDTFPNCQNNWQELSEVPVNLTDILGITVKYQVRLKKMPVIAAKRAGWVCQSFKPNLKKILVINQHGRAVRTLSQSDREICYNCQNNKYYVSELPANLVEL